MLKLIFPFYHLLLVFIIPLLVVILGFKYNTTVSADLSLIHSILFMIFFPLNGNVRYYLLNSQNNIFIEYLIWFRLLSYIPLCLLGLIICLISTNMDLSSLISIILLGSFYWLNEIFVSFEEKKNRFTLVVLLLIIYFLLICYITFSNSLDLADLFILAGLAISILIVLISISIEIKSNLNVRKLKNNIIEKIIPQIGGTFIIGISSFIFKMLILYILNKSMAGTIFIAFTISGSLLTIFTYGIGPSLIANEISGTNKFVFKFIKIVSIFPFLLGVGIILLQFYDLIKFNYIDYQEIFMFCMGLCFMGIPFSVLGQYYKLSVLHTDLTLTVFKYDSIPNISVLFLACFTIYFYSPYLIGLTYIYTGLLTCIIYRNLLLKKKKYNRI